MLKNNRKSNVTSDEDKYTIEDFSIRTKTNFQILHHSALESFLLIIFLTFEFVFSRVKSSLPIPDSCEIVSDMSKNPFIVKVSSVHQEPIWQYRALSF